jgi:hypothetical protein
MDGEDEDGRGVIAWGSWACAAPPSWSAASFFSEASDGPEPAGVRGGEAMAANLGLPFGVWMTGVPGAGNLPESTEPSREGTYIEENRVSKIDGG